MPPIAGLKGDISVINNKETACGRELCQSTKGKRQSCSLFPPRGGRACAFLITAAWKVSSGDSTTNARLLAVDKVIAVLNSNQGASLRNTSRPSAVGISASMCGVVPKWRCVPHSGVRRQQPHISQHSTCCTWMRQGSSNCHQSQC